MQILAEGDADAVSIDSVAERSEVSRTLVYKHFVNRTDILIGLYIRERERLTAEISRAITGADSVESMFRTLFRVAIRDAIRSGKTFDVLHNAAVFDTELRKAQEAREASMTELYAMSLRSEFTLPPAEAQALTVMLLGAIRPALTLWKSQPTEEYAELLEHTFAVLVTAALSRLELEGAAPR
jgi:AcrR family transcriptional regulator